MYYSLIFDTGHVMSRFTLLTVFALASLSGCSLMESKDSSPNIDDVDPRFSHIDRETQLLLKRINESLIILAETKQGAIVLESTPEEMRKREWMFRTTPPGMGVPMTVNDVRVHPEVMLKMIADATGYTIESIGLPSATVSNVTASYISRPVIEILRSISTQMGCDGLVDVIGSNKTIVVDWTIRKRGECS